MENRRIAIKADIASRIRPLVSNLKTEELLSNHTTFHIGGPADYFAEVTDEKQLTDLILLCNKEKVAWMALGGGSNILFADKGFDGVIIRLKGEFEKVNIDGQAIAVGGGVSSAKLLAICVEAGVSGLEFLTGIPGTIGGAVKGNAGSKEEWIGGIIESVKTVNGAGIIENLNSKDIKFFYRGSGLGKRVVLEVKLRLKNKVKNDIVKEVSQRLEKRKLMQPIDTWNAGSIFKNPEGESAGRLIDQAGLKGTVFGGACVSKVHANFIVNTGKATAAEVKELISIVRRGVKKKSGVDLELEIQIIE